MDAQPAHRFSLRSKAIMLALFVLLLPGLLFVLYNNHSTYNATADAARERLSLLAGSRASRVAGILTMFRLSAQMPQRNMTPEVQTALYAALEQPDTVSDDTKATISAHLNYLQDLFGRVSNVILVTPDQTPILSSRPVPDLTGFTRLPLVDTPTRFGLHEVWFKNEQEHLMVNSPIMHNGEYVGSIYTVYDSMLFDRIVDDRNGLGKTGEVLLMTHDAAGSPILLTLPRHDQQYPRGHLDSNSPLAQSMIRNYLFPGQIDYRGEQVIYSVRRVDGTDWFVVAKQDADEIYDSFWEQQALTAGVVVTLMLLSWGLVNRQIVSPILKLEEFAFAKAQEAGILRRGSDQRLENEVDSLTSIVKALLSKHESELLRARDDLAHERARNEAVARLADVGILAAHAGHDLKNDMSPLVMEASFTKDTLENSDDLDTIRQAAQTLVDEVYIAADKTEKTARSFMETVSDTTKSDERIIDPIQELELAETRNIKDCKKDNIHLTFNLPNRLPPIEAKTSALLSAMTNLIQNAAHAMNEAGSTDRFIDVRAHVVEEQDGLFIELEVKDTGPGIAEHDIDKVTEEFYTTRRDHGGTGLGLASVSEFAASCGGELRLENHDFGGLLVTVRLQALDERVERKQVS